MRNSKIVYAIVLILIGTSIFPSILGDNYVNKDFSNIAKLIKSDLNIENGSLSGYVQDTFMNPVGEVLVRVYFHETYREDYTDSSGFYHVTNIPICFCLKNATASKPGYISEWVLLSIYENTTYNFILRNYSHYNGTLSGFVTDESMNPIEGARVQVFFHYQFEEDYTDSSGYYKVYNIPTCLCWKNCTASKIDYKTEWFLMPIYANSTHDFILKEFDKKVIFYLAFPSEFIETESNYTFFGKGHAIIMTEDGIRYEEICGAVIEKNGFYGVANPRIIMGFRISL